MRIVFDPPFMPLHTAALAIIVAGAALWLYARPVAYPITRKRIGLLSLRVLLVLALTFILLNPVVVENPKQQKGKPPFYLLLDTSRSMATADGANGASRYEEAARRTIGNSSLMAELRQRYAVHTYAFSDKPAPAADGLLQALKKPEGGRTNLGAAIVGVIGNGGGRGNGGQVLLVSDGRDTAESFPLEAARALHSQGFTLNTYCIGRKTGQRDLQVTARKTQSYTAPDQAVQVAAEIRDAGVPRTSVRVDLLEEGRRVKTQNVVVTPGTHEVSFTVLKRQKGTFHYSIQAGPVSGERNTANNRAGMMLSVIDAKARVLFLEGRPSWDSKFLAQALRSDPAITLDVIYKLTGDKFFAVVGSGTKEEGIQLPRTVEQMSRYDVIIFGKGFEEFYDAGAAKELKFWVAERGGNVLFLRGRTDERTEALRELEPVTWSNQEMHELRMRLTREGRTHPGFVFDSRDDAQTIVKRMPPLISASRVQGEKALSVVLARAEGTGDESAREMATLAYIRYGQGKSLAIVGQGLWRWAFLPPDLESYGKVYQEFWSQTIRWLVSDSDFLPGQGVSIRADRTAYGPGETVNLLGYLRGSRAAIPQSIVLTLPNGSRADVAAARSDGKSADFTAIYRPQAAGEYIASVPAAESRSAPASCSFTVSPNDQEDMNTSADPDLMRQLASMGGGSALAPEEIALLPEKLRAAEQKLTSGPKAEPRTAWDRPWILFVLLAITGLEWWLRRRWGMA